ncbi:hypothetical protein KK092_07180 [Curtobacterium flaccumfaciens pv. flaccumfaciens]|uniref:hypothetical protein n=1 Tax=Curtobacterium flaccumfaciens TaxID=2035 RepID=UPI001BDF2703|nr:hypothetical protein [Curtobacterium flaccumfaciens]MBT1669160.1 hypothetical protein [Curtobacterium flaccumfaciens pv. flaccumfaciens]
MSNDVHDATDLDHPTGTTGVPRTTIIDFEGVLIRRASQPEVRSRRSIHGQSDGTKRLERIHSSVIDVLSGDKVRWTAVAAINDALKAGERVIVSTTSEPTFVRTLLDTLGLRRTEVYEPEAPGEGLMHRGQLAGLLLNGPIDPLRTRFYTATAAPVLAAAGVRTILVDPSPAAAKRASELPGVSVVTWPKVEHPTVIARAWGLPT